MNNSTLQSIINVQYYLVTSTYKNRLMAQMQWPLGPHSMLAHARSD